MSASVVGGSRAPLGSARRKIEESQMNALRGILPDSGVLAACREAGHEFRGRLLTPVVTVFHMIAAALRPEGSFRSAWESSGAPRVSTGSLCDARARLPLGVVAAEPLPLRGDPGLRVADGDAPARRAGAPAYFSFCRALK